MKDLTEPIRHKLADFRKSINLAGVCLDAAIDAHEDAAGLNYDGHDLCESMCVVSAIEYLLRVRGETGLPSRVFEAIEHYQGDSPNCPHVEGAVLALSLAYQAISDAIDLYDVGEEWDELFSKMTAARAMVRSQYIAWQCSTVSFRDGVVLQAILEGTLQLCAA